MTRRMYLNSKEKFEVRQVIYEKTGYWFTSSGIVNQMFRRSSFAAETGQQSNEIFEYIGDQILSYFVVKIVAERCGSISLTEDYTFRIRENKFSQIKQDLTNNELLAKIVDDWGIAKYLLLGKSDIANEVEKETKVKADLFESVIGAVAVESNWNFKVLENVVLKALDMDNRIESMINTDSKVRAVDIDNAVTTLKELAETGQCTMPEYKYAGPDEIGYNSDNTPRWMCSCFVINEKIGLSRLVEASSKKAAKKAAAYLILCEPLGMQNKYGPNDWFRDWSYKDGKLIPNRKLF